MSLNDLLKSRKELYPFHMPGHKRNPAFLPDFLDLDVTEVSGADNLHQPEGVIAELQRRIAEIFGADESFILVNGSTCGIEAAIMTACSEDSGLLMARNAHRSAYGGLVLSGSKPYYVCPEVLSSGIVGETSPKAVEVMLEKAPGNIDAVYLTSPSYEGVCSDIEAISRLAHDRGKLLIVDEAHGAHFGFHHEFPESAIRLGADIVIQSLHKNLPVPTQCSVLHVKGNRVNTDMLRKALSILQTSSPSYFFMAAIENCVNLLHRDSKNLFNEYYSRLSKFRDALSNSARVVKLANDEVDLCRVDPGKLVFVTGGALTGRELMDRMRLKYGVELEMCGPEYALAMTSIADTDEGFERLLNGILEIDRTLESAKPTIQSKFNFQYLSQEADCRYTPHEAFFGAKRTIRLADAENYVSADFIIPYPPGIPAIVPGEVITGHILETLFNLQKSGMYIMGLGENIEVMNF